MTAATELGERYSRQLLFAPIGPAGQERISAARVTIVGCGALGSMQAELLVRAGVSRLTLIDRDFVEFSNLQRQTLFVEADASDSLPKAVAAERRLRQINSDVTVEGRVTDLTPANAEEMLNGAEVLLDGCDNLETRYLLNDYSIATSVPWIYGAVVGSTGNTFTVLPGESACLNCIFGEYSKQEPVQTCDTAGVVNWAVGLIAALQVGECIKLLVGDREHLRGSLLSADVWRNELRSLERPARDPQCRTCAQRDFVHLRGEQRAAVTLCGRNSVQVHEHDRPLPLAELAARLRAHGEVRANDFALRFLPRVPTGMEMTVFPDGRALIKGTTDPGVARSLYARFLGS